MKKIALFLTAALIFSLCSTTVIAANHANCRNFVDNDGDGNCDNYTSNGNGCRRHSGCGRRYVDADGDGKCDNYASNGNGCGRRYIDADGDGNCDNMKYNIKYNLNGGKNNKKNPSFYYNQTKTIKLKKPTKKGYTFKGWYTDKQYRKKVTAIKKGSTGKKTLYAKWQKKQRAIRH